MYTKIKLPVVEPVVVVVDPVVDFAVVEVVVDPVVDLAVVEVVEPVVDLAVVEVVVVDLAVVEVVVVDFAVVDVVEPIVKINNLINITLIKSTSCHVILIFHKHVKISCT